LNNRFAERTEIHPNRIVFHDAEELRDLQGVGTLIKEQKIIDHRPHLSPLVPDVPAQQDSTEKEEVIP
jgi:hypothetical protein